jgi:hypothetical protein
MSLASSGKTDTLTAIKLEAFNEPAKQAEDSSPGRKPGVQCNNSEPRKGDRNGSFALDPGRCRPLKRAMKFLDRAPDLRSGLPSSACSAGSLSNPRKHPELLRSIVLSAR